MLRPATNRDRSAIISLIDAVFLEYGDRVLLDGAEADLNDIDHSFWKAGGGFWVYVADRKIVGTVAVVPKADHSAELKRVYLRRDHRGSGIADVLLEKALGWCKENEIEKLFFWSDTRFERAHSFYTKRGFTQGTIRHMNDGNMPYDEYYFEKNMLDADD